MKKIGIIPARYKSSRFPGKPLALILGKPMILHVANIVEKALGKDNTYIATDSEKIKEVVEHAGYNVVMTSKDCLTGTDRLSEVARKVDADIYINIQGDEPMVNPLDILKIAKVKEDNFNFIINGMSNLTKDEDPDNINIPKVLVNKDYELIYMSRLAIPGIKEANKGKPVYKKQVCIYAFNKQELDAFGKTTEKAKFELYEDIEILRFFDLNMPIKMVETTGSSLAVDVPEDIELVENALKNK